jgi:drug/metabolite transporter (DMT)-like permease
MPLPELLLLLVIGSGLAHAVWNLFAKKSESKAVFLWAMYIPSTIVLLPVAWKELTKGDIAAEAWFLIALSIILQSVYSLLLAVTYRRSDLSQAYPIMRGTSTLLVPVLGVAFLHESLPAIGWLGILCLVAGFVAMSGWTPTRNGERLSLKPIMLALSVGLCTTSYTLVDKLNLGTLSPLALLAVTNIGFILGLTPSAVSSRKITAIVFRQWKTYAVGAVLSPGSYLLFLYAMQHAQVTYVAPLREVGIVFGALLGVIVLKEKHGARRLAASVVVVAGIFLIAVSGY